MDKKKPQSEDPNPNSNPNPSDNFGQIVPDINGHVSVGIGGGFTIDPMDGKVGISIGGFGIEL